MTRYRVKVSGWATVEADDRLHAQKLVNYYLAAGIRNGTELVDHYLAAGQAREATPQAAKPLH